MHTGEEKLARVKVGPDLVYRGVGGMFHSRKLLHLGSRKCHLLRFLQDIFSK